MAERDGHADHGLSPLWRPRTAGKLVFTATTLLPYVGLGAGVVFALLDPWAVAVMW
jgi:hypothetical protein